MLDKKLKSEFIDKYTKPRLILRSQVEKVIDMISQEEAEKGKRCLDFTYDEILEMYDAQNFISVNVALNCHAIVKAYVAFLNMNLNEKEEIGAYADITGAVINIKPRKLYSREDITKIEDMLYNYSDMAMIECIWEGLDVDDITSLSSGNIDFDQHIIRVNRRVYAMTTRLEALLSKALNEVEYVTYGNTTMVIAAQYGVVIKQKNPTAAKLSKATIRYRMRTFKDKFGLESFTVGMVLDSGLAYNARHIMQQNRFDINSLISSPEGKELITQYRLIEGGPCALRNAKKKLRMLL
ncbi:MAG TPA: hypothetical protein DCW90_09425 [Lachnospiraceae bacterium]|nr:hypothetical protein [Lachnospiraceae bacterium]